MNTQAYRTDATLDHKLATLGRLLINQEAARVVIPPMSNSSGFWFGGGNLTRDQHGNHYIVGRYRNVGDSRTGLGAGQRGLELAVFRSHDGCASFEKVLSLDKSELGVGERSVLSIEGSALEFADNEVRLLVSTEKSGIAYPEELQAYHKPGTGVWTIEEITSSTIEGLRSAERRTIIESSVPEHLHTKDPFIMPADGGRRRVGFCTHPFNWSSSNTSVATEVAPGRWDVQFGVMPRGDAWDVAIARGTAVLDLAVTGIPSVRGVRVLFYDGGECMRPLDEHANAKTRPRGYSCEELGGLAHLERVDPFSVRRVSRFEAAFVSPFGTGCSRYVDVLVDEDALIATWQQGQPDGSQPLVLNSVPLDTVREVLGEDR